YSLKTAPIKKAKKNHPVDTKRDPKLSSVIKIFRIQHFFKSMVPFFDKYFNDFNINLKIVCKKHLKTPYHVYKTPCNNLLILTEDKKIYLANYLSKGLSIERNNCFVVSGIEKYDFEVANPECKIEKKLAISHMKS
ncbi:hypothetical protein BpHYR1_046122, partial [Brachionus plicatilis]